MLGGMNPKMMKMAMKKLGMKQEEVEATQVIIKTPNKNIVIDNPTVQKINVMGQDTFQVSGEISTQSSEKFSKEDINLVIEQTGCSEDEAKKALEKAGDIAGAILELKK